MRSALQSRRDRASCFVPAPFAALLIGVSVVAAEAPQVVSTNPARGSAAVDPALTELEVSFDRDMSKDSFSWTGGGPSFPRTSGSPRWTDPRTCVLPVVLEPDRVYSLGINGGRFTGFRDLQGRPAEPYPLIFRTSGEHPLPTFSHEETLAAVAELRAAIESNYSYRDRLGLDWNALFREHRPAMESTNDALSFAVAAWDLLRSAQDQHIAVRVEGVDLVVPAPRAEANFNGKQLSRLVPNLRKENEAVITGQFDDGIGYLLITTWAKEAADDLVAAQGALTRFAGAPGLIIDVRPNGGGDESQARRVAGRFVEASVVYAQQAVCDPDAAGGFTPVRSRTLIPNDQGPTVQAPVCVLMGPLNMSSCEAFLLMMRQVDSSTLIGARSCGSSGNPQPHTLSNGVVVMLPSWKAMDAKGSVFEGVGLMPDVLVETTGRDFQSGDPVLERALQQLR